MTLHYNLAVGVTDNGTWDMGLVTSTVSGDIFGANIAWANAMAALFAGTPGPANGIGDRCNTAVGVREAITYTLAPVTFKKTQRARSSVNVSGQVATGTGPPQASIVVYMTTLTRSDKGRLRWWLPPFTSDTVSAGKPAGLTIDHVVNGALAALRTMQTAGYTPVLLNRESGLTEPITGIMVNRRVSVLQSRAYPPLAVGGGAAVTYAAL